MSAAQPTLPVLGQGPVSNLAAGDAADYFALIQVGSLDCGVSSDGVSSASGSEGGGGGGGGGGSWRDEAASGSDSGIGIPGYDLPSLPSGGELVTNYVICPLVDLLYNGVGLMLNMLEGSGLLSVSPLMGNDPDTKNSREGIFGAWTVFRDLANVGIIIGLFFVVFSQATSFGMNAYGVRKMLPKIVIAAILINLSFVICAVLVDVFNIMGSSLGSTLEAAIGNRGSAEGILTSASSGVTGAISAVGTIIMALLMLVILILLTLFGVVCVFFLIARQILIILLIVAAPIAFIAWLFPNTESQFKKWWSTLIRLLAIYPIVMSLNAVVLIILLALDALRSSL